jgi:hypothetical protein
VKLADERWLRAVFAATGLVFVAVAIYVYGFRFFAWLESDATVMVLLADHAIHAHSPIVADWYYANGDVWLLSPQLLAAIPVAILGVSPICLLLSVVAGFAIELAIFVACYRRVGSERWTAVLAALVTMAAWSNAHVAYEYIQLAYGWVTCLYVATFALCAVAAQATPRPRQLVGIAILVALIAVQNPARGLVYDVAPVLAACAWPWRELPVRRRLGIVGAVMIGWAVAYVAYTFAIAPSVELSVPRGHLAFAFGELATNLATLGRGIVFLTGGTHGFVRAVPGIIVVAGAVALVVREVLRSRAVTALRFASAAAIAQLGVVLVPVVVGNLLDGTEAIRYVMPSLLAMFGLAVIVAVRAVAESGWWRQLAIGWLVLLPIAAGVAALDARPPHPRKYIWPDADELSAISDELGHRQLTHGFAINLGANLLTLDSHGDAHTCPITFRGALVPQRWLAATSCFDARALPDRFFVVLYQADALDHASAAASLPAPIERFSVGPTYEVLIYRTADTSTAWLDGGT